tara:strand:- start:994 stop:1200 length:207 start_codon:yes stop_codon:yes gene_type:complete
MSKAKGVLTFFNTIAIKDTSDRLCMKDSKSHIKIATIENAVMIEADTIDRTKISSDNAISNIETSQNN